MSKTLFFIMAFLIPFTYMLVTFTKSAVKLWKTGKTEEIHGAVAKCKVRTIRFIVMALLCRMLGMEFCCGIPPSLRRQMKTISCYKGCVS